MSAEFFLQSLIIDAVHGHGFEKIEEYLQQKENSLCQKYNQLLLLHLDELIIKVISRCSHKGKSQLLDSFLVNLGLLVADKTIDYLIRKEALRTLNSILEKMPRGEMVKFPLSENKVSLTKGLAMAILEIGDYDLQVALSEALCRMMSKKSQADLAHRLFEDDIVAVAFKEIRDREFETDSRRFLNCLNDKLGDKRRVYTFPCIAAFVDGYEVRKPHDENLEKFWIDFNIGSQSITFYIDNPEDELWDSIRLLKEAVSSFSIKEAGKKKVLVVCPKKSLFLFNNKEVMKIEIHFDLQSDILKTCMRTLGPDKYLLNPNRTKKEPSETLEDFKEQESLCYHDEKAVEQVASKQNYLDSLKEMDKTQVPKSDGKPSYSYLPVTAVTVQESSLKTVGLKKRRKRRSSKNIPKTQENSYDFEKSFDHMYSQVVVEAKQRILSHKRSSKRKRASSAFSSYKSQGRRKLFSDFRKHLFSESNCETSSDRSGSSWVNSQKGKNFKTYLKQKKPRVRSKLRVLPLSPASSGSDQRKVKPISVGKRISRQNKNKTSDLPVVEFQDSTVFLTPEDSAKKKPFQSASSLCDASSPEYSDVTEDISQPAATKSSMESAILKRKQQNVEVSDFSDHTLIKPKHQKLEEDHTSFSPLALMPGENTGSEALQVMPENLGESSVISTFENFIKELKKRFKSRNKKKDVCFQNSMKASEKLTMLLDQIHQCRLDKIEEFHMSILQKLDNFKKDVQALKDLENEILDVWKEQCTKLNSFCDLQMQRLNYLRKR
ncbi:synaptonemal complex protein 2-like isoform 2-T2 [Sarcophilus harrisii]